MRLYIFRCPADFPVPVLLRQCWRQDYEGKVFVVDNQRISVTQRQSVMDAMELAAAGKSGQEIYDKLMENKMESSIYIMLDTLYYLKKGGRITPAAAALGTLVEIKTGSSDPG